MRGYANQKRLLQRAGGRSAGREDLGYIFSPHGVAEVYVKPKPPASEKGGSISQAGSQLPFPRILSPGQGLGQSRAQSIPAPARDTVLTVSFSPTWAGKVKLAAGLLQAPPTTFLSSAPALARILLPPELMSGALSGVRRPVPEIPTSRAAMSFGYCLLFSEMGHSHLPGP